MDEDVSAEVTANMANYAQAALSCPGDDDGREIFRRLVLKFFGAIQSKEPATEMRLAKEELWLLQTIAKPFAEYAKEKVGLAWLSIISSGLLHLEAQGGVHQAVMQHGENDIEEYNAEAKGKMTELHNEEARNG